MKKILFVCTGNTCRSPMAELICKKLLRERGVRTVRVSSAGLAAEPGGRISENAAKALAELGIRSARFRSRPLTEKLLAESNLVVTMTSAHKRALAEFPRVFAVGEFSGEGDVPDPYGGDLACYRATRDALLRACGKLLETIL